MPDNTVDAESLGYEQARDELAEVVRKLEAGGVPLEESLALWERGEQLATICQRWLDGARMRIAAVTRDAAGETTDADTDDDALEDDDALDDDGDDA